MAGLWRWWLECHQQSFLSNICQFSPGEGGRVGLLQSPTQVAPPMVHTGNTNSRPGTQLLFLFGDDADPDSAPCNAYPGGDPSTYRTTSTVTAIDAQLLTRASQRQKQQQVLLQTTKETFTSLNFKKLPRHALNSVPSERTAHGHQTRKRHFCPRLLTKCSPRCPETIILPKCVTHAYFITWLRASDTA